MTLKLHRQMRLRMPYPVMCHLPDLDQLSIFTFGLSRFSPPPTPRLTREIPRSAHVPTFDRLYSSQFCSDNFGYRECFAQNLVLFHMSQLPTASDTVFHHIRDRLQHLHSPQPLRPATGQGFARTTLAIDNKNLEIFSSFK